MALQATLWSKFTISSDFLKQARGGIVFLSRVPERALSRASSSELKCLHFPVVAHKTDLARVFSC
jgi:hypothetical protein